MCTQVGQRTDTFSSVGAVTGHLAPFRTVSGVLLLVSGVRYSFAEILRLFLFVLETLQFFCACLPTVGGVNSAREQDSSVGGDAGYVCLGAVHMEEEVQGRVHVEVEREEQGERETHGQEQSEEQKSDEKQSTAHRGWLGDEVTRACRHLSQCGLIYIIKHAHCAGEK